MSTSRLPHGRRAVVALVALAAIATAGCSASSSSATTASTEVAQASQAVAQAPATTSAAAPAPAASAAPSDTPPAPAAPSRPTASAAPADAATAVPTSIDPCQLIPAAEAGKLAGTTFGPGVEKTLPGNSRMCTYGANTRNVFEVIVAVAPDVATARRAEASAQADLKANAAQVGQGITITKLPGFAPGVDAVLDQLKPNSIGVEGVGMNVLKGTVFVGFNDLVLDGSGPSADAMKAEAMTVIGRLP